MLPLSLPRLPLPCRLALAALLATFAMPAATSAAPASPRPLLGSTVFAWEKLTPRRTANGERREVANHASATLDMFESHITTLDPGKLAHAPHRHAHEEIIIIKEGRVEVDLNDQKQEVGPGSVLFYASNDPHGLRNVGDTRATYWVFTFGTPATANPAAQNPTPSLPSGVNDWEKIAVVSTKTGERRQVLKGATRTLESLTCHVTTLNAGLAPHGAHQHPDDEIIVVREGTMEVTINDGTPQRGGAGSIFFLASNEPHGMRNAGNTRASYYVIRLITSRTPKPPPKA